MAPTAMDYGSYIALFKTLVLTFEEFFVKVYITNTSWGSLKEFLATLSVLIVC